MASRPITSWQIDGETMETEQILFSWAPKSLQMVTAATQLKKKKKKKTTLALWKKSYAKTRQCIKSRDITLLTKFPIVKAMDSPLVIYGCKNSVKKAEYQRTDAFELWFWRRLESPLVAKRSNQSILKEINPNIHCKGWC